MGFKRGMIQDSGLGRPMRQGDGSTWNPALTTITADANDTLTVAKMAAGAVQYTGFTAGRNLTTDTAANILAAFPEMDVGDSVHMVVSIVPAFAGTLVAGTGVTLAGRATVPASSSQHLLFTKTSATAVTCTVL